MEERAGVEADLGFKALRALQAYLGYKNIQHTVRYTELSPARFKDFWR
jgi:type 1 fimbriae regulatory protein FimB/type 1 fimbriae regulatory protein FimE